MWPCSEQGFGSACGSCAVGEAACAPRCGLAMCKNVIYCRKARPENAALFLWWLSGFSARRWRCRVGPAWARDVATYIGLSGNAFRGGALPRARSSPGAAAASQHWVRRAKPASGVAVGPRGCLKSAGALQQRVSSATSSPGAVMMQRDLGCRDCPGLGGELFKVSVRCLLQALAADFQVQNLSAVPLSLLQKKPKQTHFWVGFFSTYEQLPPCLGCGCPGRWVSGLGRGRAGAACGERGWRGASGEEGEQPGHCSHCPPRDRADPGRGEDEKQYRSTVPCENLRHWALNIK